MTATDCDWYVITRKTLSERRIRQFESSYETEKKDKANSGPGRAGRKGFSSPSGKHKDNNCFECQKPIERALRKRSNPWQKPTSRFSR